MKKKQTKRGKPAPPQINRRLASAIMEAARAALSISERVEQIAAQQRAIVAEIERIRHERNELIDELLRTARRRAKRKAGRQK